MWLALKLTTFYSSAIVSAEFLIYLCQSLVGCSPSLTLASFLPRLAVSCVVKLLFISEQVHLKVVLMEVSVEKSCLLYTHIRGV